MFLTYSETVVEHAGKRYKRYVKLAEGSNHPIWYVYDQGKECWTNVIFFRHTPTAERLESLYQQTS